MNIQAGIRAMKKLFLIAVIAICIQDSFAQLAFNDKNLLHNERVNSDSPLKSMNVPQAVRDEWKKDYSSVSGMEWYQTPHGFMACYEFKNFQSRVLYDAEGNVVMHSREIDSANIPALIYNFMKKKYPGVAFGKMYMNYPVKGQDVYEVQVGESSELFDVNGNNIEDKNINRASR